MTTMISVHSEDYSRASVSYDAYKRGDLGGGYLCIACPDTVISLHTMTRDQAEALARRILNAVGQRDDGCDGLSDAFRGVVNVDADDQPATDGIPLSDLAAGG